MKTHFDKFKLLYLTIGLCFLSGCGKMTEEKVPVSEERLSLTEIQREADSFSGNYKNLDFSNTTIKIPEQDAIANLVCTVPDVNVESKMLDNIKKLKNTEDVDMDSFFYKCHGDEKKIALDAATEAQKQEAGYLIYNDGEDSAILYLSSYMMEIGHSSIIAKQLNVPINDTLGNRLLDEGAVKQIYDISDENIPEDTYQLVDGRLSIKDAVAKVEQCINTDYHYVKSDFFDNKVYKVEVRSLDDNIYYYQFYLASYYNGIRLCKEKGGGIIYDDTEDLEYTPFAECHTASMMRANCIDYIWSCCNHYVAIEENEVNTEFISLQYACQLLSESVSESKVFEIDEINLEYETDFYKEAGERGEQGFMGQVKCHPVYSFRVSNPHISGYGEMFFYVDALTGKVGISGI